MVQTNSRSGVDNYGQEVADLLKQLDHVAKDGRVPKATAIRFIEKSAWWVTHPSGPVRVPGDAKNLKGPENKPVLKLGANTFKVGVAILSCRQVIQNFLAGVRSNPNFGEKALPNLRKRLVTAVCGSVSAFDGRAYKQYPMEGDQMLFGAHAINVREFIDCLFEVVPVDRFIRKQFETKQKDRDTERAINLLKNILKETYKRNVSDTSCIAAEMKRRDPNFSIKSTHFKKFTDLLHHCAQGQPPQPVISVQEKSVQKMSQPTLKFSENLKKFYKAMLLAENRAIQVENALLTLQLVDDRLRTKKEPDSKAIFSALTEAIHINKGNAKHLGSLLTRLFSHQQAAITKKQDAKPIAGVNSQLRDLLKTAGFEVSKFGKAE